MIAVPGRGSARQQGLSRTYAVSRFRLRELPHPDARHRRIARLPSSSHQTIHPYTDLLVHDMGDSLTDSRQDFEASGREWRTPALWGIGLTQLVSTQATFMHDGRARTLEEAMMWHGGEAMAAREAFRTATKADRDALIAFLMTL